MRRSVALGCVFNYSVPGGFGIDLLASKRLSANAVSSHDGLSFPGWLSRTARFDIGPFCCFFFLEAVPFGLPGAGGLGSSYHAGS